MIAQLRRVPRAGWMCFLIALVNCAIWTVVVPPFQVPDEISHFGYAQYVAQTGKLPPQTLGTLQYSPQEYNALDALWFFDTIGRVQMRGILTPAEDHGLREALAANPSPVGPGGSTSVTNQPPLYYALEAVPYWLSPSSNILVRLELMRLLSALMAACTVLLVFLFLRELLPRVPWAWSVGALVVAFQPTFCFIAAGVQGDNLLFLASTATFLLLLRAWRRGLTLRRGALIGLAVVAGVLGKLTFIALLPGVALALALLGVREVRRHRSARVSLLPIALAAAIVLVPVALYAELNVHVWHRGGLTAGGLAIASVNAAPSGQAVTLRQTLDYTWEDLPAAAAVHAPQLLPQLSPLEHMARRLHRPLRLARLRVPAMGLHVGQVHLLGARRACRSGGGASAQGVASGAADARLLRRDGRRPDGRDRLLRDPLSHRQRGAV